ncbi:MAG: hypothetical protein GF411_05565 [Candidatus Lokiarchaeota archaeon]|nr:hypothetical protein [Candidatus Lokiarchaeota archaeon]
MKRQVFLRYANFENGASLKMAIRLNSSIVETIEDTETKKLKLIKIRDKEVDASIELELPKALSDTFQIKEEVSVVIDSEEIPKGESARLYGEGTIFKMKHEEPFEVVATLGGLRLIIEITKPKKSQTKAFEKHNFFIAIK